MKEMQKIAVVGGGLIGMSWASFQTLPEILKRIKIPYNF